MIAQAGVYWPFKALLEGSGIVITETATTMTVATTGAGPGGGDMLKTEYATNGVHGIVDHAATSDACTGTVANATFAQGAPWTGITGKPTAFPSDWSVITNKPTIFPTDWSVITNKPTTFAPTKHGSTHLPTGTDSVPAASATAPGWLAQLSGKSTDYVGGDNACHLLLSPLDNGDSVNTAPPDTADDEFRSTTGLSSKWTVTGTKTGATLGLVGGDFLQMAIAYGTTGAVALSARETVVTAAGFMFQFKLRFAFGTFEGVTGTDFFLEAAIMLLTGSKAISLWLTSEVKDGVGYPIQASVYHGASATNLQNIQYLLNSGLDLRVQMGVVGTNFVINVSPDAINWTQIYNENFASGGGFGGSFPNQLLLQFDNAGTGQSNSAGMVAFDYVRKIA